MACRWIIPWAAWIPSNNHSCIDPVAELQLWRSVKIITRRSESGVNHAPRFLSTRPWRQDSQPFVWGALALCLGLLLIAVYLPALAVLLKIEPLDAPGRFLVLLMSLVPWLAGQVFHRVREKNTR